MVLIFLTSISLAMDSFSASIIGGFSCKNKYRTALKAGIFFGGFQGLMSLLGWLLGGKFESIISNYDHWIAFLILAVIGVKMIIESSKKPELLNFDTFSKLILVSIATSIDALAIGISFNFLQINILTSCLAISLVTFVFCFAGVLGGERLGKILGSKISIIAGIILMFIGLKILLSHTLA
jgi:putative Mn2+ efflux pump MntP